MDQIAIVKRMGHLVALQGAVDLRHPGCTHQRGGGGGGTGYRFDASDFDRPMFQQAPWLRDVLRPERLAGIVACCCCLLFLVIIASIIVQYVSRAALIRSVDQIEETGHAPSWRAGLRLGWTNRTFRLWLLELIVGIIVGIGALVLLLLAASPLLLLLTDTDAGRITGIVLSVMLFLFFLFVLIAAAIVLSVLQEFWSREVLLADRGIGDALSSGYTLVRSRLRDVGGMWLVMTGIAIGFGFVMIPIVLAVIALSGGLGAVRVSRSRGNAIRALGNRGGAAHLPDHHAHSVGPDRRPVHGLSLQCMDAGVSARDRAHAAASRTET